MGEDEVKVLDEVKALESSWDETPLPRPGPPRDTGETEFDFRLPGGPSRLIDQVADELAPTRGASALAHPPPPRRAPPPAPTPPPPPTALGLTPALGVVAPPIGAPPNAFPGLNRAPPPWAAQPPSPPPPRGASLGALSPSRAGPPPSPPPPRVLLSGLALPPVPSASGSRPNIPGLSAIPKPLPPPVPRPTPPSPIQIGDVVLKMPAQLAPPIRPEIPTTLIDGQAAALDHAIASSLQTGHDFPAPPRPAPDAPLRPPTPAFGVPAEGINEQQMARIIVGTPTPGPPTPVELRRVDLAADLLDLVPERPVSRRSAPPASFVPRPRPEPAVKLPASWRPFILGVGITSLLWLLFRWWN